MRTDFRSSDQERVTDRVHGTPKKKFLCRTLKNVRRNHSIGSNFLTFSTENKHFCQRFAEIAYIVANSDCYTIKLSHRPCDIGSPTLFDLKRTNYRLGPTYKHNIIVIIVFPFTDFHLKCHDHMNECSHESGGS